MSQGPAGSVSENTPLNILISQFTISSADCSTWISAETQKESERRTWLTFSASEPGTQPSSAIDLLSVWRGCYLLRWRLNATLSAGSVLPQWGCAELPLRDPTASQSCQPQTPCICIIPKILLSFPGIAGYQTGGAGMEGAKKRKVKRGIWRFLKDSLSKPQKY